MKSSESRHRRILDVLQETGRVDVASLATELETSVITVRRDLEQLAALGALRRVRGGAVATAIRGEGLPFSLREVDEQEVKARLGRAVADLIADGEAVIVDSGTTGVAAARALAGRRVTVMPMSVQAIAELSGSPSVQMITPAGTVRAPEGSIVGPLVESTLASLRFDTAVLTCCGASLDEGITAFDLQDAATKQAVARSARRTVLIAEGTKFSRSAMAVVRPLTEVDVVVTSVDAPVDVLRALEEAGVMVITA